jgi:glycosyltransferase involved in cell wall biosynthesis
LPRVAAHDSSHSATGAAPPILLSICLPTFDRARHIERQLEWLADEVTGVTETIEIVVSDNCSSDDTPDVIASRSGSFGAIPFRSQRHETNRGWMRNFLSCYEAARGRYCWVVGDDDVLAPGTLRVVLDRLAADGELSLLYLNFLARSATNGEIAMNHWFDPDVASWPAADGERIYMHCIEYNIGAVITVSAAVCRTDLALEAIREWPPCLDNWAGMAYWCAHVARHGHVAVTAENYFECAVGDSYWQREKSVLFRVRHRDIPQVYAKLAELGYPRGFCLRKIAGFAKDDLIGEDARSRLADIWHALVSRPLWAFGVIGSYVGAAFRVGLGLNRRERREP